jgi:hypothetical protein
MRKQKQSEEDDYRHDDENGGIFCIYYRKERGKIRIV